METTAFGTVDLYDGQATLPVGPGVLRPVGVDFLATVSDRSKMALAAAFIDSLPRHIEKVRETFLDAYEEIAKPAPAWLKRNAGGAYATLFAGTPDPRDVTPAQLWNSLDVETIWTRQDGVVTVEFGFRETDMLRAFAAEFGIDGTLESLAFVA